MKRGLQFEKLVVQRKGWCDGRGLPSFYEWSSLCKNEICSVFISRMGEREKKKKRREEREKESRGRFLKKVDKQNKEGEEDNLIGVEFSGYFCPYMLIFIEAHAFVCKAFFAIKLG